MICARIASSPPPNENAIATHSAAIVIAGSVALFRSGHGRCNRPDVAVILAESQRLSVRVVMAMIAAAIGATVTTVSINCSYSPVDAASLGPMIWTTCWKNARSVPVIVAASGPRRHSAAHGGQGAKHPDQDR